MKISSCLQSRSDKVFESVASRHHFKIDSWLWAAYYWCHCCFRSSVNSMGSGGVIVRDQNVLFLSLSVMTPWWKTFWSVSENAWRAFQRRIKIISSNKSRNLTSMCVIYFKLLSTPPPFSSTHSDAFEFFLPTELSSPMPLDSDMKKQEHLWQINSPNFLAEKAFNDAVAVLKPYCAVCSLFCPYTKVEYTRQSHSSGSCSRSSSASSL